jgi:uncharacterized protein
MPTIYEQSSARLRPGSVRGRKVQFVVVSSKFCNLRCSYCYEYPDLDDRTTMSPDQFEHMYRSIADHYHLLDHPVAIEFDWHGGEPLLLGADFYWRNFDLQTKIFDDPRVTVTNCVQTNLTVLNDRLIKVLREGFDGVGVSIDLFATARLNAGGRDLQPTVLANMDILREAGVTFGAITVLSRRNRPHLEKIFRFFCGRIDLGPHPAGPPGRQRHAERHRSADGNRTEGRLHRTVRNVGRQYRPDHPGTASRLGGKHHHGRRRPPRCARLLR